MENNSAMQNAHIPNQIRRLPTITPPSYRIHVVFILSHGLIFFNQTPMGQAGPIMQNLP